jgi:sirohydrochlorin cobaltochelatase
MNGKAILVASFGTTKDEARNNAVGALEREVAAKYPEYRVDRAFTSSVVVSRLAARGIMIDTPGQALNRLAGEGVKEVFVLPTHLIPGEEYEKLCKEAEPFRKRFDTLCTAKPLLYDTGDLFAAADAVSAAYPVEPDEALLLMGHGTAHFSNCFYPAMDYVFKNRNGRHVFLATVEGYPEIGGTLDTIVTLGFRRAALVPFMLVAGDHAINDMAGDGPDSWKTLCEGKRVKPRCILRGLGELPAVRKIYLDHLKACIGSCS